MGHFLTNRKYGNLSTRFREQGIDYFTDQQVMGLNSNLNLLEDFSPVRSADPFRWIPQGLFYDLIDDRNDLTANPTTVRVPLDDNVLGNSNRHIFNALESDVNNLPSFRLRLLNENGNNQSGGVNSIFSFYGY